MHRSPFVLGLAAVFAGLTALLAMGAVVSRQPVALAVALPFGVTSYLMYYHGSGKLARAVTRQQETRRRRASATGEGRGGFGAGPRSRGGPRTRADREARASFGRRGRTRSEDRERRRTPQAQSGPTREQARKALGVGVTADQAEIRRAYRQKVKEVHPDRGGDEEAFKRVTDAYDRLKE